MSDINYVSSQGKRELEFERFVEHLRGGESGGCQLKFPLPCGYITS
jgi:hypothetical protein